MTNVLSCVLLLCLCCSGCACRAEIPSLRDTKAILFKASDGSAESLLLPRTRQFEHADFAKMHHYLMKRSTARTVAKWAGFGEIYIEDVSDVDIRVRLYLTEGPESPNCRIAYKCTSREVTQSDYFITGTLDEFRSIVGLEGEAKAERRTSEAILTLPGKKDKDTRVSGEVEKE